MYRTTTASALRRSDAGSEVTLAGWVARIRNHGGVAFLDLRDSSGVAQVTLRDAQVAAAEDLRVESCVTVTGLVRERPAGNVNAAIASGEVELEATAVTVLAASDVLPFQLDDEPGEETRLAYRYLDLRREAAAYPLKLRSKVSAAVRSVLVDRDFVEVETPTLTRSTPEGARDFLVPARLKPGTFYALPQSPQLFKQLLMVGGFERYFQIARCYRDEDFRADRQPEFTQLDIEMSFVEQADIIELMEGILTKMWALVGYDIPTPIPHMTYADAMRRFGSDKPDLR
ncbi:MAG: aspartate--tRNA ligase, partial [Microbacteriaceae bacterium]|nr:aspartate--tRNA ligase [Microbacteriaceae bacterium]